MNGLFNKKKEELMTTYAIELLNDKHVVNTIALERIELIKLPFDLKLIWTKRKFNISQCV